MYTGFSINCMRTYICILAFKLHVMLVFPLVSFVFFPDVLIIFVLFFVYATSFNERNDFLVAFQVL